jgi:hypothetical protein
VRFSLTLYFSLDCLGYASCYITVWMAALRLQWFPSSQSSRTACGFRQVLNKLSYHDYVRFLTPGTVSHLFFKSLVFNAPAGGQGTARVPLISPKVIGVANSRGTRRCAATDNTKPQPGIAFILVIKKISMPLRRYPWIPQNCNLVSKRATA